MPVWLSKRPTNVPLLLQQKSVCGRGLCSAGAASQHVLYAAAEAVDASAVSDSFTISRHGALSTQLHGRARAEPGFLVGVHRGLTSVYSP